MADATASAPPKGPVELARWLRGEWTITRVTRAVNGDAGSFTGRAQFTPDPATPAGLIWHEHGRLALGGHEGPAERTLRIEPADDGTWLVRFADGRPFHALDLASGNAEATHLCGADTYRGHYVIENADRFTVTWRITGPHKDDVIESAYDRVYERAA